MALDLDDRPNGLPNVEDENALVSTLRHRCIHVGVER
jgi:hypothetical protein